MIDRQSKARLRAHRTLLLASVAFSATLMIGLTETAFAAGGKGGDFYDGGERGTGQNFTGGTGGTSVGGTPSTAAGGGAGGYYGGSGGGGGSAGGGAGGFGAAGNGDSTGRGGDGGNGGANGLEATGNIANTTDLNGETGGAGQDGVAATNSENGTNTGGGGGGGGAGGYGLIIRGAGQSSNAATIQGGAGGRGGYGPNAEGGPSYGAGNGGSGGAGGVGVLLSGSGATFANSGNIYGGRGGSGGGARYGSPGGSGAGGAGIQMSGIGASLNNGVGGNVIGGAGYGAAAGAGVLMSGAGASVTSAGTIVGGSGITGTGGAGISFTGGGASLNNSGTITGGDLPGGGGGPKSARVLIESPLVPAASPAPGNGVDFLAAGGSFTNGTAGAVAGGAGSHGANGSYGGAGGVGGTGANFVASGTINNSGAVTGGQGGAGGSGYAFNGAALRSLEAAAVPAQGVGGAGGVGGVGASFVNGGNLVNTATGTISGGIGGVGGAGSFNPFNEMTSTPGTGGAGGTGGVGVLGSGLTITNAGTITGGAGAAPGMMQDNGKAVGLAGPGAGGVGIVGANLTITNSGTISGGLSGDGLIRADAIQFTGGVNTLTIASTSVINGNVVAFSRADTLGLGGDTNGSFNLAQVGPANSAVQYQGFGILQKTGASTWTLSGAPIGTTLAYQVAAGTLNLGGTTQTATSLQMTGGTLANGTLTSAGMFDMQSGIVTGNLAGTGALTKSTAGTVVLAGTNTYTGDTNVNGGTLQVDGVITASNVIVNDGGTLSGVGKIGDPTINAGGTLAPGNAANPYGTLTIVGPLGFAAGSFYNVAINPTANSRTNVVGTTTISGGTVQVLAGSGTYAANQRYTILTSTGGVAGTFTQSTVNTNFAFLTPKLSYDANAVYLTVLPSAPIVTTNPMTGAPTKVPDYRTAAGTQNQRAVAAGLTQAGIQNGGTGRVLNALNQLTTKQAQAAFDALSGEGIAAAQNVANRSTQLFTSSIFDQTTFYSSAPSANSVTLFDPSPIRELADLPSGKFQPTMPVTPNRTWRAWATGYGGVDNIHGDGRIGSAYQQNTIYGGTLGVDYQLTPNYLVGVALGGSNGDFRVASRATSGSTTGGHVAFYDLATFGSFYGASSTSFSYFGNRATRTVSGFGGLNTETERANFNSNEFRSRLEFGRHFAGYGGVLTPFVALELAQLRSNGFTESAVQGAGLFRLNVSGQSQASAPAFVGVRLQRVTSIGSGITISPTLQVAYVHEFAPFRSQIGTIADLPGSTFLVDGARPARNAAQVKAGAEMAMSARSALFVNFDGEFSGVNQLYAGKGGFRYAW